MGQILRFSGPGKSVIEKVCLASWVLVRNHQGLDGRETWSGDFPLWELWLPSFGKMGLTSRLRQGSTYRLVSGRQRPNSLCLTANNGRHEAGDVL